jgi:hypothetical protein
MVGAIVTRIDIRIGFSSKESIACSIIPLVVFQICLEQQLNGLKDLQHNKQSRSGVLCLANHLHGTCLLMKPDVPASSYH